MDQFGTHSHTAPTPHQPLALSRRSLLLGGAAALSGLLIGAEALEAAAPAHAAETLAWGGYTNGRIPLGAMTRMPDGTYLRRDAATAATRFNSAFHAAFGTGAIRTQAYRTFPSQLGIFVKRYVPHKEKSSGGEYWRGNYWVKKPDVAVAAIPGTSNHGWGLAIDFSSGIEKAGSPQKKWADVNGPKFAWYPVGNDFGEPWHFEFHPGGLK
ncbi:M15 family metallopeptidase [Frondihabitans australicus]|uniref:D-alanyl-D-alanine carboxypeptidase-like protein n=1 Tax=Frondihabitans australicus TaxID=386892 RepID=A0A495IJM4_9MICO|nr:M15 family metallopeptidase [Frondihabitans australicus]RKR75325.1 D-alanyl-D-alanine carboxypeptidase-like protein [Frondihabitans australicus]